MEESHILPVKWLGTQIMHKILSADKKKRYLCKTKKNPPNYYSINFFISVSPLTIVLAHKQIVFHWHHLSSMSQLMAHTFLSSGCSPSRSKLEIGECAHISNLYILHMLPTALSLHRTNGQITVYKHKSQIFASHKQCNYPIGRKGEKASQKKRLNFLWSNIAGNDKYAPKLFRINNTLITKWQILIFGNWLLIYPAMNLKWNRKRVQFCRHTSNNIIPKCITGVQFYFILFHFQSKHSIFVFNFNTERQWWIITIVTLCYTSCVVVCDKEFFLVLCMCSSMPNYLCQNDSTESFYSIIYATKSSGTRGFHALWNLVVGLWIW